MCFIVLVRLKLRDFFAYELLKGKKVDERNTQEHYHDWTSRISNRSKVRGRVVLLRGGVNR